MDSSSYGSSHLSSPALVVFSQAANGLSDALRLQRPFPPQMPDAKDLHHLSLVSNYGAHLLHGFQPNFLHPHFNPAVSTASSTNPFSGGGAFVKPFPSNLPLPSAFAPPKWLDQSPTFSPKSLLFGSESFRTDSSSPACTSLSPPTKDESLEGHSTSEESDRDRDRICSPSRSPETPGFRRVGPKKTPLGTPSPTSQHHPSCPVCGVHIPPNELESHFSAELNRIAKPNSFIERQELRRTMSMEMHSVQSSYQGRTSRWETFNRIRNNRQSRLRGKFRKRRFDGTEVDFSSCQSCPVCHGRLQRTQEEIAQHIEECARKQQHQHQQQQQQATQNSQDEDETVDVESIGDETSNNAINMSQSVNHHPPHHPHHHNNNIVNNNNNNNNNNTLPKPEHCPPPYTHKSEEITSLTPLLPAHWDRLKHRLPIPLNCNMAATAESAITRVTPTSTDQRAESEYGNRARESAPETRMETEEEVLVDTEEEEAKKGRNSNNSDNKNSAEEATSSVEIDSATETVSNKTRPSGATPNSDSYVSTSEPSEPASKAQVLEELKARIRELEGSPHYKCYICKEGCKTLVISTICGHYLCEDCWVTESDNKKSCPRCKIVTANSDFRKIHV